MILSLLIALAPPGPHPEPGPLFLPGHEIGRNCTTVARTAYAMGTLLRVEACARSRADALTAIDAGFKEVKRLEDVLSSWRPDTEVGRLNAALPDARFQLSPELKGLLDEAGRWVKATDHAFDPAIGSLIDAWGFRTTPRVPDQVQLEMALNASGWSRGGLTDSATMKHGPAGWWIDTGGFGKGAAIARLADTLRARGAQSAIIDFGGQIMAIGDAIDVGVADPRNRSIPVSALRIRDVSVSTSSQSEHYIESAGRRYGHIIDPRTGQPVPAWGSVTVVARDPLAADALSTALFVMGPAAALSWARGHPDIGVLILESMPDGKVRAQWSRAMEPWVSTGEAAK